MDEMRTLACPICKKFVLPDERLVIENFNGEVVIWHVQNWSEIDRTPSLTTASFTGWCGNNFGRAERMPSLTS